jgi:hypothetical protein
MAANLKVSLDRYSSGLLYRIFPSNRNTVNDFTIAAGATKYAVGYVIKKDGVTFAEVKPKFGGTANPTDAVAMTGSVEWKTFNLLDYMVVKIEPKANICSPVVRLTPGEYQVTVRIVKGTDGSTDNVIDRDTATDTVDYEAVVANITLEIKDN